MKEITIWNGTEWEEVTCDNEIWFAVVSGKEDTDHGTGSFDLEEAARICRKNGGDAYIVAVDDEEDFALAEINLNDVETQ